MSEIIRLVNVVKMLDEGRRVINGMNLSIQEKERVAVCGAPGSGKGALMRLIGGMEPPSAGKVFVLGQAVHEMDADKAAVFRNRNIGIVHREPGLMERLNIFENVLLPLAIQGIPLSQRKQAVKEQLKTLGISHIAHAYPAQLSAYETRIVSIARALINQPKILLLYEVMAGLSERDTEQSTGVINAIFRYGNYTVLTFSVNTNNGLHMDKTILLNHGKIQEDRS
ncbi:MAG: ATP-binding cassette domain-containing protein [Eubacteriales bacterium]|nr:ATP-binding cassette domain-containing protein [Eubacteriales bacterium]